MGKISVKAGDIITVNLDPTIGGEKAKTRPCLVLVGSGHPWGIIVVVPITADRGVRSGRFFVPVPIGEVTGLSKPSCVDVFQIRCLSEERVVNVLGQMPEAASHEVRQRLASLLDIGPEHVG